MINAARIAVATALRSAINSSGVRALNGCLITLSSIVKRRARQTLDGI